ELVEQSEAGTAAAGGSEYRHGDLVPPLPVALRVGDRGDRGLDQRNIAGLEVRVRLVISALEAASAGCDGHVDEHIQRLGRLEVAGEGVCDVQRVGLDAGRRDDHAALAADVDAGRYRGGAVPDLAPRGPLEVVVDRAGRALYRQRVGELAVLLLEGA